MTKTSGKTTRSPSTKRARQIQMRQRHQAAQQHTRPTQRRRRTGTGRWPTVAWVSAAVLAAVLILFLIYQGAQDRQNPAAAGATGGGSGFKHVAGQPGAGATAPAFTLTAHTGKQVSLADYRGQNVLLYFQEGLMCQPCWDQIRDLEQNQPALKAAGVDAVVSITTDPADLIARKMTDEKLSTPALSDPDLTVSRTYTANQYGMMGTSRDGHTFILIGPDGIIDWRADYGGPPDFTMYLPTQKMLADLAAERKP